MEMQSNVKAKLRPVSFRQTASLLLAALALSLSTQAVFAGDFPGKGNRSEWSEAIPYYNLANKQLNDGRYKDAAGNFEAAIALYKFDPDFHLNLGVALRKMDDYPGAESAFKTAAALSPDDWMCWSNLANAYLKQNKLKQTIAAFERTLKSNPPESERAAILKDITDIRKILSTQDPDQPTNDAPGLEQLNSTGQRVVPDMTPSPMTPTAAPYVSQPPKPLRKRAPGGAAAASDQANPFHRSAPPSAASSSGDFEPPPVEQLLQAIPKSARSASTTSPGSPKPAATSAKSTKPGTLSKPPASTEQKQLLKDSGWDYIYK